MFKKLLLGLGVAGLLGVWSIALVNAQNENFNADGFGGTNYVKGMMVSWAQGGETTWGNLIGVIKKFINWVLWLLALITLVIVLRGGFKMVTAAGDEGKFKEWFKILKQAGIGLAIIGLSWFIVSIIFRVIWGSTTNPVEQTQ